MRKRNSHRFSVVGWFPVACVALVSAVLGSSAVAASGAHEPIEVKQGNFTAGKKSPARPLAEISAYCLSCHGEDAAGADRPAEAQQAPKPAHSVGGSDRSHPVDVAYPVAKKGYASLAELAPRLQLIDGRIACITCHDLADPSHELVVAPEGSQLCVACHKM